MPRIDREFYGAFAVAVPFEITALIFYIKALRISPLSLTLPFLSLTPVVLVGVSYVMLGERVSLKGGVGICCLAAGGYLLHFHTLGKGILEPLRAITKEKGSVFMIITALIYSLTSTLGKMAIIHSSPLFFGLVFYSGNNDFCSHCVMDGKEGIKGFHYKKTFQSVNPPGILPGGDDCFAYDSYQHDKSCLYDFSKKDESVDGSAVWLFFIRRKKYEGEIFWSFIDVHRFCADRQCCMSPD